MGHDGPSRPLNTHNTVRQQETQGDVKTQNVAQRTTMDGQQPMRQRLISLNVEKESSQTETPWDLTQFARRSPKKPQRPRAVVQLRVHAGLGLEKQKDHLRAAV